MVQLLLSKLFELCHRSDPVLLSLSLVPVWERVDSCAASLFICTSQQSITQITICKFFIFYFFTTRHHWVDTITKHCPQPQNTTTSYFGVHTFTQNALTRSPLVDAMAHCTWVPLECSLDPHIGIWKMASLLDVHPQLPPHSYFHDHHASQNLKKQNTVGIRFNPYVFCLPRSVLHSSPILRSSFDLHGSVNCIEHDLF